MEANSIGIIKEPVEYEKNLFDYRLQISDNQGNIVDLSYFSDDEEILRDTAKRLAEQFGLTLEGV